MNSELPYKSPDGIEPRKSNTVLIVVVVLVVLAIPALCLCGGGAVLFLNLRMEGGQDEPFIEIGPPIEPVPPIEAVPPVQPATGGEP